MVLKKFGMGFFLTGILLTVISLIVIFTGNWKLNLLIANLGTLFFILAFLALIFVYGIKPHKKLINILELIGGLSIITSIIIMLTIQNWCLSSVLIYITTLCYVLCTAFLDPEEISWQKMINKEHKESKRELKTIEKSMKRN